MTSSLAGALTRFEATFISIRAAGTAHRSASPELPGVLSPRGAPVISTSATTAACAAAAAATAPSCRPEESTAAWPPAAAERSSATAIVARKLRRARTAAPRRPATCPATCSATGTAAGRCPEQEETPRRPGGSGTGPPALQGAGGVRRRPWPTPALPRGPGAHQSGGASPPGPGRRAAGVGMAEAGHGATARRVADGRHAAAPAGTARSRASGRRRASGGPRRPGDGGINVPLPAAVPLHVPPRPRPGPGAAGRQAAWAPPRPRHPAPPPAGSGRAGPAIRQSAAPAPDPPAEGLPVRRRLPCSG